jgi:hypothetical protein
MLAYEPPQFEAYPLLNRQPSLTLAEIALVLCNLSI